jgi:stress-induced morphogen
MPIDKESLEKLLRSEFNDAEIEIMDLAGDNDHYEVSLKSSKFNGLSRVQQHQLVYSALQGKMGTSLHALSIKTAIK